MPLAAALAVALCLSWGFNQVAIKLALPEIPPLIQAAFRSTFGALIVIIWARMRGVKLMEPDGTLIPGIAAGVLFGLEFMLIFRGLRLDQCEPCVAVHLYCAVLRRHRRALAPARRPVRPLAMARVGPVLRRASWSPSGCRCRAAMRAS